MNVFFDSWFGFYAVFKFSELLICNLASGPENLVGIPADSRFWICRLVTCYLGVESFEFQK